MGALNLDYMLGLAPTLLRYVPVTSANTMAMGAMMLALALVVILALWAQ